jgi:hypothetical protein
LSEREEFTGVIVPRFWEDLRHLPLEVRALAAHLITCRWPRSLVSRRSTSRAWRGK